MPSGERSARVLRGQRIGAGLRFAEAVSRDHLGVREFRQILAASALPCRTEHRQRADSGMGAVPAGVRTVRANPSATIIMEVRSISMPPNFSGMMTPVNPSSADFLRNTGQRRPGPRAGSPPLRPDFFGSRTRPAVRAMARCSSVKSSGVKISAGRALLDQESAAFRLGNGKCSCCHDSSTYEFSKDTRRALAAADAHRHHSVARVPALHFAQDGGGELRAGATQRMPQRNGAAVGIHVIDVRPAWRITASACTANASFSSITPMSSKLQPGQRQRLGNRHNRADAHDLRRHAARPRS